LMNYNFRTDAERIAKKFLDVNKKLFARTGKIWEKFDVVKGDIGTSERYPTQFSFGWTNTIIVRLINKFGIK